MHKCPTCGATETAREGEPFTDRGVKAHHARVHGESLTEVTLTCPECGGEFTRQQSNARGENTYCSKECKDQAWDKGVTDEMYRGFWKYREEVQERDEVCQRCGHDGSDQFLDVHHITPVRKFDDPDKAHQLSNLVLLCRSCHRAVEGDEEVTV
jgi:5-methylcytosine-specific restriction endonuclease McrA